MTAGDGGPNRVGPEVGLDPRFGEDGAEPLPWDEALGLLERTELSWLSTVTTGANALHSGTDLVIESVARRIVDGVELLRVADAFEAKYGPEWRFEVEGESFRGAAGNRAQAYDVVPRVGFGFAKGPYGQTRWRFPTA